MLWSKYDLRAFMEYAIKVGSEAEKQLDDLITIQVEAESFSGYTEEMVRLANLIGWSTEIEKKLQEELDKVIAGEESFVSLDADTHGEYIVLCARLQEAWNTHPTEYFQGASREDITYQYYLLGNIEGHLQHGKLTMDMVQMLDLWSNELNEKEEA